MRPVQLAVFGIWYGDYDPASRHSSGASEFTKCTQTISCTGARAVFGAHIDRIPSL